YAGRSFEALTKSAFSPILGLHICILPYSIAGEAAEDARVDDGRDRLRWPPIGAPADWGEPREAHRPDRPIGACRPTTPSRPRRVQAGWARTRYNPSRLP